MIFRILFQLALLRTVLSLSIPTLKDCQRQLCRAVGVVVATSLPLSAHAVEVIKINADIPALIQIAKDNKDIALKLAQQTVGVVKITDYPKSYTNWINFARDVAAGDVFVEINGIPIDVSLLSEKGGIDVDLSTEVGEISVTVSSEFLPKVPFLSKRVAPLSNEVFDTSRSDSVVEPPKVVRTRTAAATQVADIPKVPLLDQPFILDPFEQGWTVKQVLGSTSLGLGVAYSSSYAYYIKSQEDEAKSSAAKKKNVAVKKAPVEKESAPATTPDAPAAPAESPVAVKTVTSSMESSTLEPVPVNGQSPATRSIPGKVDAKQVEEASGDRDEAKKSRGFLGKWRKEK